MKEMKQVSAYLKSADVAVLDAKANLAGKSRSEYVKQLILDDLVKGNVVTLESLEQRVKLLEEWKEEIEAQRRGR